MGAFRDSEGHFDPDLMGFGGNETAIAQIRAAEIQAQSGREAIAVEQEARERAQGFFEPFAGVAEAGLEASKFLADPQAQFDFLQNNPLFQMSLDNANMNTQQSAAARGRLSAGDTLQQLSRNTLLSAQPLLDRQRQDVNRLLGLGTDIASAQANVTIGEAANVGGLTTDIGAAQAAGQVGAAQSRQQGQQNMAMTGMMMASMFSDPRLKENITFDRIDNGYPVYTWIWGSVANTLFGLTGCSFGVMANDIEQIMPEAVTIEHGYMKVDYAMIGVKHGGLSWQ